MKEKFVVFYGYDDITNGWTDDAEEAFDSEEEALQFIEQNITKIIEYKLYKLIKKGK